MHRYPTSEYERIQRDRLEHVTAERDTYRTLSALIAALWLVTVVAFAVHGG